MAPAGRRAVLLAVAVTVVAVEAAADVAWSPVPPVAWVSLLGMALTWSLVGALAWWRRPRSGIGKLMIVFGVVLAAMATSPGLRSSGLTAALLVTVAGFAFGVAPAPGAHVVLAYPSGRLPDRLTRGFVVAGYVWGVF
jgi:hypothetical protein